MMRYWSPSLGVLLLGIVGVGFFLGRRTMNLINDERRLTWFGQE